jgi:hypothetical protein
MIGVNAFKTLKKHVIASHVSVMLGNVSKTNAANGVSLVSDSFMTEYKAEHCHRR